MASATYTLPSHAPSHSASAATSVHSPLNPHSATYAASAAPAQAKSSSFVVRVFKGLKTTAMALILVLALWLAYSFGLKYTKGFFKTEEKPAEVKSFSLEDSVSFSPQLGLVNEISSDKTVDAILSGSMGPAVLMFHADWCGHCKNMEPAYAAAAKDSSVPFVKVNGSSAPVSSNKYAVTGYPTVFGISALGLLNRYSNARTAEAMLEFTRLLVPTKSEPLAQPMAHPIAQPVPFAQPAPAQPVQPMAQTVHSTAQTVQPGSEAAPMATVQALSSMPSATVTSMPASL